jgi:hypothetical protein
MEEIHSLKSQVNTLQATQGAMAGDLDSTTTRVATCEQTLQQHASQLRNVSDHQMTLNSQWESFHQK